ncbi:hypothetical protein FPANT_12664 [Fusarium pseudoanthophilum]|uniref:Uncharacterized protein n=1 Tax=Fusarium pseudoanthophilum TaxID=48495 RepID=A0A8H5NR19_9HYPO|nr:hypothetical protein FPANT_12664 [Fusarium pseudoanthophilum]
MSTSKALIEWAHTVLSLPSVDTLYNYRERETPKRFNPDPTLTAFHIYTTNRSRKPRVQPLKNNSATYGRSWSLKFHDAWRHVVHQWDSDIRGLRLNYDGGAWAMWDDNKARFCNLLENKPRFAKAISDPGLHPTGVTPLWVLRGFFIGPDTKRCPPYIAVMCSKESLSRHLVDCIQAKLQSLQENDLADWGVTRLPNVHVSEFGASIDNQSSSSEELPQHEQKYKSAQEIRIHLTERDLPVTIPSDETRASWDNLQHRSGIRLSIFEDSIVYRQATIGGLVQVGEGIFGLTVAHVFSSEYSAQRSDAEEEQQNPVTAPNQDSEARMGDSSTLSGRWRNPLRRSMIFDWALLEMPPIETYNPRPEEWEDVNLVQTISGDFRPVLVFPEMPVNGTPVVLATPGSALCLWGIVTGEDALVNMPGSPNPYITWVLRMEQPWLIRSGDSGSWAFDAGSGDLLGILVAGCPELHEAYIIPAHQVLGDIRRTMGKDVRLPNSYPITEYDHQELTRLEKTILAFRAELELLKAEGSPISVFDLERIDKEAAPWLTQAKAAFSNAQRGFLTQRGTGSRWLSPRMLQKQLSNAMRRYNHNAPSLRFASKSLTSDERQLCEDMLRRSPLECFNFLLNELQESLLEDRDISVPALLWVHLILGERSLMFPENDVSTAGYHISQVIEDERRSCANYSMVDLPRDRSNIETVFRKIPRELERAISWEKEYYEARIPEMAPFEIGLHTVSCDLVEKIELQAKYSRFWLKDHNVYVDVVAYQMVLSEDEWQSAQSTLYDMSVTSFKRLYAEYHVYGWQDRRVLQALALHVHDKQFSSNTSHQPQNSYQQAASNNTMTVIESILAILPNVPFLPPGPPADAAKDTKKPLNRFLGTPSKEKNGALALPSENRDQSR